MTKYSGFSPNDLKTIKKDVINATQLARRCENALLIHPGAPTKKLQKLLADTFMLPAQGWKSGNNWNNAYDISMLFGAFRIKIQGVTCKFSKKSPTAPGAIPFWAFVKRTVPNVIFVTPKYFNKVNGKERSAILIHEYIHIIQRQKGHPGGVRRIYGGQTSLGIPFRMAFDNPYCYEYFALWL